jgi:DNA processing protein
MSTDVVHLRPADAAYPPALATLTTAPELWVRGAVVPDDGLAVAIVGSRAATTYGKAVAEELASDLAGRGVTIVSGFARGVDTAAHRGALAAGGRTIAVLGAGIDVVYPPENVALVREIAARGAASSWWRRRSAAGASSPPGSPPISAAKCLQFRAKSRPRPAPAPIGS